MKKMIAMLITGILISMSGYGKKVVLNAAPEDVVNAFNIRFPNISKVTWETVDSMNYYATFQYNRTFQIVKFDKQGMWLESIEEMESDKFSREVWKMLEDNYGNYSVFEAKLITSLNASFYQILLYDGSNSLLVQILTNGVLLIEMEIED